MRWKFLFIKYRPDVYWWSMAFLSKGVVINFGIAVIGGGVGQLYWIMSCSALYVGAVMFMMPWRHRLANVLEIVTGISVMFCASMTCLFAPIDKETKNELGVASIVVSFLPLLVGLSLIVYLAITGLAYPQQAGQNMQLNFKQIWASIKALAGGDKVEMRLLFQSMTEWDQWHCMMFHDVVAHEFLGMKTGYRQNYAKIISGVELHRGGTLQAGPAESPAPANVVEAPVDEEAPVAVKDEPTVPTPAAAASPADPHPDPECERMQLLLNTDAAEKEKLKEQLKSFQALFQKQTQINKKVRNLSLEPLKAQLKNAKGSHPG